MNNHNKPFLKWAGNKYRVLPHLIPLIGNPKRYCEPFGGTLAVALNVTAQQYILNDMNRDLIAIYQNLVDLSDDSFIKYCQELFIPETNTKESYLEFRKQFNYITNYRERARLFIYLNKHCFNGLSRYNKKGEFNVPFGKHKQPTLSIEEMMNFRMFFLSKQQVTFTSLSFNDLSLYKNLEKGDVVYFDPPYVPISKTAQFTSYTAKEFTHQQQVELSEIANDLHTKGIKVILSNHDTPATRELYKNATLYPIQVTRTVAAKGTSRKKVNEIIAVWNNG